VLNIYMTGHPLEEYKESFKKFDFNLSMIADLLQPAEEESGDEEQGVSERDELLKEYVDKTVVLGGMMSGIKKKVTKSAKLMASAVLEDLYGSIEIVFFPAVTEKFKDMLVDDTIVKIKGKIIENNDKVGISVNDISFWSKDGEVEKVAEVVEEVQEDDAPKEKLYVKIANNQQFNELNNILEMSPGKTEVVIQFENQLVMADYKVSLRENLLNQIRALVGKKCVLVK